MHLTSVDARKTRSMGEDNSCEIPFRPTTEKWTACDRNEWTASAGISGQLRPEWVDSFNRNGWTTSTGIGGQFGPEYACIAADLESAGSVYTR